MTLAHTTGPGFDVRFGYPDETAYADALAAAIEDRVASRLEARDHTLWGPAAEEEAMRRLDWVVAHGEAGPIVADVAELRAELVRRGHTRIVLCGMGGSSLAPELICSSHDVPLVVLDSTHPTFVRRALVDLEHTVVVVASKSGGTVETDSQRRIFEAAFADAGIDPVDRIVVITDPGSPLATLAAERGYRTFLANPHVGGRFSALTAFGLVPSGLAGADIGRLVEEAREVATAVSSDSIDNPALRLGVLLGMAHHRGVDKLVLADAGSPFPRLGDWIEQLVAESTGKHAKGILPVVVESPGAPNFAPSTPDSVLVSSGPEFPFASHAPASGTGVAIDTTLGAALLLWETATAIAGRLLGINPFDQPDVESAKVAARTLLESTPPSREPLVVDRGVAVYADDWLTGAESLTDAINGLLELVDDRRGYLAIQAYLDRGRDASLGELRARLATVTGRPVTFGWGPRFLHSTGQLHKGGPATGVFLQITAEPGGEDLTIPGLPFTAHEFVLAQAQGDGAVLASHGRPVLHLHLATPDALHTLREVLG